MRKSLFLLPAALLFVMLPAYGANLVVNAGFETGDFTGWTTHTCTGDCGAQGWFLGASDPHTGADAAGTACVGVACLDLTTGDWIKQTLTTVPSTTYNLTFWMDPAGSENDPGVEIDAYWNNDKVGAFVSEPGGYHQYSVSGLVATSTSTVLEFTGRHDPATVYLDDIDVEASGATGTPEPMSFMLSGLGLALLGLVRARRAH
jgi:hypothetical protein